MIYRDSEKNEVRAFQMGVDSAPAWFLDRLTAHDLRSINADLSGDRLRNARIQFGVNDIIIKDGDFVLLDNNEIRVMGEAEFREKYTAEKGAS